LAQRRIDQPGINFFIHDLHPFGGQDRSTLEILNQLSKTMAVHVYAYTYQNPVPGSGIIFHQCPPFFSRPVLFKSIWFQVWSAWVRVTGPSRLTFSTGTCALFPDIVHVQFVANAWKEKKGALRVKKSPLFRIYHRILATYNEWLERKLFSRAKTYAAISGSVASDLRHHFNVNKVSVIHHGVDVERFRPPSSAEEKAQLRRLLDLPANAPLFIMVGSYDRKGLAALVAAGRELRAEFPEAKILAVGDGDVKLYQRLAGPDADWLILRKPSKEIERYFRAADFFVLPTLYEPFGLVILEAMSSGLPVIVSKTAGAAELIHDGENGVLLNNPSDPQELARAMAALLANTSRSQNIGRLARTRALGRSWGSVASEFQGLIQQAGEFRLER
jgi:UDP-glucose:(heptosyl)LPS alpha-1,3-glucosyltransferase